MKQIKLESNMTKKTHNNETSPKLRYPHHVSLLSWPVHTFQINKTIAEDLVQDLVLCSWQNQFECSTS